MWGTRTALLPAANESGDGVSEKQLQAQAWVPGVLAALLRQAERAMGCILSDEDGALGASTSVVCERPTVIVSIVL